MSMRHLMTLTLLTTAITGMADTMRQYYTTGNLADTIITVGADFARINGYAAIEVRASLPNTKQQQDLWHESFGFRFHQTSPECYWQATLTPANTDYGSLSDEAGMRLMLSIHREKSDSILFSKILTSNIAYGREENSIAVEMYENGEIKLFAGNGELELRYNTAAQDILYGERSVIIQGQASASLIVDECEPSPDVLLATSWTLPTINSYFTDNRHSLKPLEGYWSYLDQDTNDTYARLGGEYRVAIIADDDGGYMILYVSGAKINPQRWHSGMLKGRLQPSLFPNNYNMLWFDAEMQPVYAETFAQSEQEDLLSLNFPTLKSIIRLYRVPMDK